MKMDLLKQLKIIRKKCVACFTPYLSNLHGLQHLREVAYLAGRIALEMGTDIESAMVAGFLHDCARVDDLGGNEHAHDSAKMARPIIKEEFPLLDADAICDAIYRHADGETSTDPLAGALWDADRLTLQRLGHNVRTKLLSTEPGKKMARMNYRQLVKPAR